MTTTFPVVRLRRLRQHPGLRSLIRETELNVKDLVLPIFVKGTTGNKQPITSMPGFFQIPVNKLSEEIEEVLNLGISSVILFGIPPRKDPYGTDSYHSQGIIQEAIREIRKVSSDLLIISDVILLVCNTNNFYRGSSAIFI